MMVQMKTAVEANAGFALKASVGGFFIEMVFAETLCHGDRVLCESGYL